MKTLINLPLSILLYTLLLHEAQSKTKCFCDDNMIYTKGRALNEYLIKLKKIMPGREPYSDGARYKIDLDRKVHLPISEEEYNLHASYGLSPNCEWMPTQDGNFVNTRGDKLFIDFPGNEVYRLWSPDSTKIAYITGETNRDQDSDHPPKKCTANCAQKGVWVYDINSKKRRRIPFETQPYSIAWPCFDGNIYMQTSKMHGRVYRYFPNTDKVEETPYLGINFSSDGKYYFMRPIEGQNCHVYLREPHKELVNISKDLENIPGNPCGSVGHRWLADGHSLVFPGEVEGAHCAIVYDIDTGKIRKIVKGYFVDLSPKKDKLLVIRDVNQFEVIDAIAP